MIKPAFAIQKTQLSPQDARNKLTPTLAYQVNACS
jgi:hypothetical protein